MTKNTEKPETVTLEKKSCTFEELLAEARAAEGVSITEINPCQCVTVETSGRPALLIVKEV